MSNYDFEKRLPPDFPPEVFELTWEQELSLMEIEAQLPKIDDIVELRMWCEQMFIQFEVYDQAVQQILVHKPKNFKLELNREFTVTQLHNALEKERDIQSLKDKILSLFKYIMVLKKIFAFLSKKYN
jgi:hypothetical protein